MAVTYESFITKYDPFQSLDEYKFEIFIADALIEINHTSNWRDSRDRATEMLLGHFLLLSDVQTAIGAQTVEAFKIDDRGYEVAYQKQSNKDLTDYSTTWMGREYERLLKIANGRSAESIADRPSVVRGNVYHGVRGALPMGRPVNPIDWY